MTLPITILLPTRNSMKFLPEHIERMAPLLPLVKEVVHVDSQSNDGTVEYARKHIAHPNYRFFDHPPGLYQSWNFGIQQAQARSIYISTVGDSISADGLKRLHEVSERIESDVLVSVPKFETCDGKPADFLWPVHRMIQELQLTEPKLIQPWLSFSYALRLMPEGILNSSASNLYRTDVLKARPFPSGYGTSGDTAWGISHALDLKFGIVPETFSTFLIHDKTYSLKEYEVENLRAKMAALGAETAKAASSPAGEPWWQKVGPYLETLRTMQNAQNELYLSRKRYSVGWMLVPSVWKTRALRNKARRAAGEQFEALLHALSGAFDPPSQSTVN